MKKITILLLILLSNIVLNAKIKIIESENSIKVYDSKFENSIDNKISYIIGVDQFDESRLNVRLYESESSSSYPKAEFKNKATYSFERIGIKRGLQIASIDVDLQRIDPLTNKPYKLDSIKFEYKFAKEISLNNINDFPSFPNVINLKQIGSLITQKDSKTNNQTQSNNEWFDSNLDYYKFYSQKDGIARINHSELLKFNSSLNGKDVANIQIFNRGQKLKFYSTNNTIASNNFLYFVVSHAYGDTSYYDFYNGKEPYFITYNPNDLSTTYDLIDNNLKGQSVSEVVIENHYEKDRVYGNGVNVVDTETSLCENWYFEELRVQNDYNHAWEFFTDFSLFPVSDLKIEYEYASNIYYLPPTVHNKTLMNINTQVFDTVANVGSGIIKKEITVSKNNLLQGGNTLNLNSYRVVDDQAPNDFNGIIGFDYYKIKGKVRPIAENGYFSFLSDNNVSSNVTVSGFPDNLIVAVDTTNNTIQFPSSSKNNILSIESKDKYSSIFYNSQLLTSHIYGYHIVTDLNGNKTSKDFKNENDFIGYLDATDLSKDNAIIINLENTISTKLKSKLQEKFKANLVKDATSKFFFASINNKVYESNTTPIFINLLDGNYYSADINLLEGEKSRKIVNSKTTLQEITLIPSKIKRIVEGNYDAFYVYHPEFEPSIDKYINYMSEKANKKILKLDVEQLYDTYGYGIESPHSIKNFFQTSYDKWKKYPEFLTIIGDATWDPKMQRAGSFVTQLVPAYGIPYTDNFYGTVDGDDILPELIIGRIPVNTNQELENYLDKVKTFYDVPLNPWMKNVLQIAGGDDGQKDSFKEIMEGLNGLFAKSELAFDTTLISKATNDVINETQADEIKKEINEGKMWVNFLGHGSPSVIDMSGWEAPNLNNQGKYGVLNTLSCNTSAFAEPSLVNSIGEEFVNIKEKGFIACIGGTSTTDVARALTVSSSMFLTMFRKDRPERNIGRIFDSFKARNYTIANVVNQVVLLGDPLIDLRIAKQPDLILNNKDIKIKNEYSSSILTENNKTANIEIKFFNLGTRTNDSVNFRLIHTFNNTNDTIIKRLSEVLYNQNVSFAINIENAVGEHSLTLFADNDSLINDINYTNNQTSLVFNVFSEGIIPLEPLNNWNVLATNATFRFVNPTNTQKSYDFVILDSEEKVAFKTKSPSIFENYIEVTTSNLKSNQKYTIQYSTKEVLSGVQSATNTIDFHTLSAIDSIVHYKVDAESSNLQFENLKIVDNILKFDDKDFGVKLSSARGSENAERHSLINTYDISNDSALFSYVIRLRRGFNIVVIPDELNDSNVTNIQFDTWATRFNDPDDLKDARLLDEFLSDSLKKGDYLLLATADVPMRAPDKINDKFSPDSTGSSTRIKKILNDLGAKFADNLEFNSSYVLFTRIGYPESTIDNHTLGDTIQLTAQLTRYQTEANIRIPNIGNAKKLLKANIDLNTENTTIHSNLINKNSDTSFVFEGVSSNFPEFDTQKYQNFDILTHIKRDSIGAKFEFYKFGLDFIPEPELAMVKSKTNTDKNEYERGFNALYDFQIENISTRSKAENLELQLLLENNFISDTVTKLISVLSKNSKYIDSRVYETKNAANINSIITTIDPNTKINELFTFNNTSRNSFRVIEDTTKPWLIAYADSIEIIENNYVSEKPVFVVELYDKSPQQIVKDNVILARVNRKIMLNSTTDTFNFEIINKGDLKARITFSPNFLLDIGENTLFVIGEDATGNHADTLDLSIFLSKEFRINNLINFPNPFDEFTSFRFNYIGRDSEGEIEINIFNAIGSKVRKLNRKVNFGVNEMLWDGKDDYGNSISSGVYFYKLDIVNKASEPVFGKMIKVN